MVDIKTARGGRIKKAIERSGKSQREVADEIGIAPQSITKWIKMGRVTVDNLQALAEATGTDVRYLISGENFLAVSEKHAPYYARHGELHALIDKLDTQAAKKLSLCARAILDSEDMSAEISITVGGREIPDTKV